MLNQLSFLLKTFQIILTMLKIRFIIFWLSILAVGCTKIEKVYVLPDREDIVSTIYEKIMTDGALSIDGLNDSKAYFIDYSSSSLSKMLFPDTVEYELSNIQIGRNISQVDTTIIYDIKWDSAYVDIKYYLRGDFKIVLYDITLDSSVSSIQYIDSTWYETTGFTVDSTCNDTTGICDYDTTYIVETHVDTVDSVITWSYTESFSPVDSTTKSFTHRTHQKAIFLRTQNTNNATKDWQLHKITPMIFEPTDNSPEIRQAQIALTGTPSSIVLPTLEGEDPLLTYFNRDSLPLINYNGTVTLSSVLVENDDPYPRQPGELVMAHFGHGVNIYKIRKGLSDSDDDGSHTGNFSVNSHGTKVYRLFIDLIDYDSIFTGTGAYKAHIWMIPFQVP